jgi:hypothetical protein
MRKDAQPSAELHRRWWVVVVGRRRPAACVCWWADAVELDRIETIAVW